MARPTRDRLDQLRQLVMLSIHGTESVRWTTATIQQLLDEITWLHAVLEGYERANGRLGTALKEALEVFENEVPIGNPTIEMMRGALGIVVYSANSVERPTMPSENK